MGTAWGLALASGPRAADVCLVQRSSAAVVGRPSTAQQSDVRLGGCARDSGGHDLAQTNRSEGRGEWNNGGGSCGGTGGIWGGHGGNADSGGAHGSATEVGADGSAVVADQIGSTGAVGGGRGAQVRGPSVWQPGRVAAQGPGGGSDYSGAEQGDWTPRASQHRGTRRPASAGRRSESSPRQTLGAARAGGGDRDQELLWAPDGRGRRRAAAAAAAHPRPPIHPSRPSSQPPHGAGDDAKESISRRRVAEARSTSPDRRARTPPWRGSHFPGLGDESPRLDEAMVRAAGTASAAEVRRRKTAMALTEALRAARDARWSARMAASAAVSSEGGGRSYNFS
jgi:hypothetical protein